MTRSGQTQLSSYENAEYSFNRKGQQLRSRAQQSAEAFMNSHSSGNFIQRFSHRLFSASHVFMGVLFALFIVVLLIAILLGTNVYRSLFNTGQQIAEERVATSLLFNTIRAADSQDALSIARGPQGPALVLSEFTDYGTYETRIYQYNDEVVEEYTFAESPFDPQQATPLLASDVFDFQYRDGLLTVITDQGQTNIAIRSVNGNDR